jgi:Zn-dependent protease
VAGFNLDPTRIAILMLAFVVAITVHEFMHAWTAYQLGDDTAYHLGRISLNPAVHFDPLGFIMFLFIAIAGFGFAWGKPVPVNTYRLRSFGRFGREGSMALVALAGPLSNVVLATAGALSLRLGGDAAAGSVLGVALETFVFVNVGLAAFNMIPVPPLDGYRIMLALVPRWWQPVIAGLERYAFGILLLLLFVGRDILSAMIDPVYGVLLRVVSLA